MSKMVLIDVLCNLYQWLDKASARSSLWYQLSPAAPIMEVDKGVSFQTLHCFLFWHYQSFWNDNMKTISLKIFSCNLQNTSLAYPSLRLWPGVKRLLCLRGLRSWIHLFPLLSSWSWILKVLSWNWGFLDFWYKEKVNLGKTESKTHFCFQE